MRLLICASGSTHIGLLPAYIQLLRRRLNASLQVVLTRTAESFMPRTTLTAFSGGPVYGCLDEVRPTGQALHIELADWAEHILILPATAHTIHRLSHGAADDLLSTTFLAAAQPITIAPAMHRRMWQSGPVRRNIALLQDDGHHVLVGPSCPPTHLNGKPREGDAEGGLSPTPKLVLTHLLHLKRPGEALVAGGNARLHVG